MDKTLLKKAAVQSVALMLGVIMLSYAVNQYNTVAISASNNDDIVVKPMTNNEDQEGPKVTETSHMHKEEILLANEKPPIIFTSTNAPLSVDILRKLGELYLVIKKPEGEALQLQLEDYYNTKNLKLLISGEINEVPEDNFIGRVNGKDVFVGEPIYSEVESIEYEDDGSIRTLISRDYGNDPVVGITIANLSDDISKKVYEIDLQLNHVYVHIMYEDDNYYYIDLRRPKDVYEKVLVIDPGHGGKDPGAISKDNLTYEKDINLKIVLALKELLDKDNIKVYYTRLKDDKLFLRPRVTLANDVDCDFFISIHCNANNSSVPNGTEILYYDHNNKNVKTKDLAKILNEELSRAIPLKNSGLMKKKDDDVFILSNATVPAVIVETGYMSNSKDIEYLRSETGQHEIAKGIYNGIIRAYEELLPELRP